MLIIKKSLSVKLRNTNFFLKLSAKARNFTPPPFRLTRCAQPGADRSPLFRSAVNK